MKKYNGLDPRIFKSLQIAKNLQRSLNDYHVGIYNGLELSLSYIEGRKAKYRDRFYEKNQIIEELRFIKNNIRFNDLYSLEDDIDILIMKIKSENW